MELLVFLALIPAVIVMWYIWKKDKVEKEPTKMILKVAGAGAISTISAIILELIGDAILKNVLEMDETSIEYGLAEFFLVVACAEELGKLVALRLRTWGSKEFNFTYDAVVYAVASSLGFAALENILYVAIGGIGTAFIRAFTAIPGHAMFGVFMGYYYGMARQAWGRGKKGSEIKNMLLAFIVPVILHGIYDFLLFEYLPEFAILIWLAFLVLIFILAMMHITRLSAMDTPILGSGFDFPEERKTEPAPAGSRPVDMFGQPYPQPVRPQPAASQPSAPYGQTSAPSYGQNTPPSYGRSVAPQYGQAPSYGQASAPSYGQSIAPQYGQTPSYGQASVPSYGQNTPPSYGRSAAPQYGQAPSYGQPAAQQYGQQPQPAQPYPAASPQMQQPQSYEEAFPQRENDIPPPTPVPETLRPKKIYHPEGMEIPDEMMGILSEIDEEPSVRYDPFGIAPAQIVKPGEHPAVPAHSRDLSGQNARDDTDPYGTLAGNVRDPYGTLSDMGPRRLPPLE